jgi:acetyltransferase-like isoleucine patch superfamily enzyme
MEVILKNPITLWLRWLLTWFQYKISNLGKHNRIEYGAELTAVKLGAYSAVYKHARLRSCSLDDFSYVARDSQVHHATIGKFCCIGPQVLIGLGEHPSKDFVSSHPMFYSEIGQANPVIVARSLFNEYPHTTIGHDVWIGARAIIRSGITIGNGAIIASGAVVTKDVAPYSIVGGVPAQHIRFRFTDDEIAKLERLRWWDNDLAWFKQNAEAMRDVKTLLSKAPTHYA